MSMRSTRVLLVAAWVLLVAGCPRPTRAPVTRAEDALVEVSQPLELRDDGTPAALRIAIAESLVWLKTRPVEERLVFGKREVPATELRAALERLHARITDDLSPQALTARVLEEFEPLESAGGDDGQVLFTGYYEPTIEASLTRTEEYAVPILGPPGDLIEVPLEPFAERFKAERVFGRLEGRRVVPYWNRAEIRGGKLDSRKLELAWAKDPVALFFVEVQGSGTLRLPDGSERRIGYAASNGRPYRSIGSLLIQEGVIPREAMSMQALRAWLAENPSQCHRVLDFNESYVFFRFLESASVGSLGRPVTPGRSIATDARMFPKGALAFIHTERPVVRADGVVEWKPLSRFVLNQDTGGAIRGAGRVDVFWGRGPEAELSAGMMKQKGRLLFLVPRLGRSAP
ncbi:murein transglycosylase A [Hyalangium rubrum]|uniref:peptidoglycan lytic exotransglycosylase n=1 Tax=Hyalangium rubrum TaxID=3103134 RepID=A0ABU5H8I8_9BACT|nr:MltA domain-containing protein [Hyalangium sp. s54d21]MDY7229168.1 MltA domain-containing protein [Hyalangium sp. s54d21]